MKKTVHETFDHIIAVLIVGLIFIGAVIILPRMSYLNIQSVDQQQLRNTALNVFNAILLDTGEPANWSLEDPWDSTTVKRFGLADYGDSTYYVLDPDKVQRLVEGNPLGELKIDEVKRLLHLEDYGFRLRIIPPFNITKTDGTKLNQTNSPIDMDALANGVLKYDLKVTYLDGRPIPNAVSSATIINTNASSFSIKTAGPVKTNALGILENTVDLGGMNTNVMVILRISVSDVATLIVTFGNQKPIDHIADVNMVGDTVILTRPDVDGYSEEERRILAGYAYSSDGSIISFFNGSKSDLENKFNYGSDRVWERPFSGLSSYDPVILIFNIWARPYATGTGKQEVIVAGLYQKLLGQNVFQYGDSPQSGEGAVRLQRSVIVSGMTYTAEFVFWKET
ncbi:MAG: hypothetical protein P8X91_03260 [Candidatus Bathyarchaeota archaeon]